MKRLAILALLPLAACGSIQQSEVNAMNQIASTELPDIQAAYATAVANNDLAASTCFAPAGLQTFVTNLQTFVARPNAGPISRFEKQRIIDKFVIHGPPDYLQASCMYLVADTKRDARDLVARFFSLLAQAAGIVANPTSLIP